VPKCLATVAAYQSRQKFNPNRGLRLHCWHRKQLNQKEFSRAIIRITAMTTNTLQQIYSWEALSHADSIRLLTLRPSISKLNNIKIDFYELRLSDSPYYEALSYCWATEDEDDTRSSALNCNGKVIPITKNCEAALRRLRVSHRRAPTLESRALNLNNTSVILHNTLPLFTLRRKMAARPFLPFGPVCGISIRNPNDWKRNAVVG
jgi:hypothetical protein